jgi:hypothetical protein
MGKEVASNTTKENFKFIPLKLLFVGSLYLNILVGTGTKTRIGTSALRQYLIVT